MAESLLSDGYYKNRYTWAPPKLIHLGERKKKTTNPYGTASKLKQVQELLAVVWNRKIAAACAFKGLYKTLF